MKKSRYDQVPFAESFVAFAAQRETLVARLANLPSQAWQRLARVCVEQRESPLTLHERIRGMAHHEAIHCTELERACAAVTMGGNAT